MFAPSVRNPLVRKATSFEPADRDFIRKPLATDDSGYSNPRPRYIIRTTFRLINCSIGRGRVRQGHVCRRKLSKGGRKRGRTWKYKNKGSEEREEDTLHRSIPRSRARTNRRYFPPTFRDETVSRLTLPPQPYISHRVRGFERTMLVFV